MQVLPQTIADIAEMFGILDDRAIGWTAKGRLLHDPKRAKGEGKTLAYGPDDMLAAYVLLSLETIIEEKSPVTATWIARKVLDRVRGLSLDEIEARGKVSVYVSADLEINLVLTNHVVGLRARIAEWQAAREHAA